MMSLIYLIFIKLGKSMMSFGKLEKILCKLLLLEECNKDK